MKMRKIRSLRQLFIPFVLPCLTLTGFLLPVSAYCDSTTMTQTSTLATTLVNNKTPNTNQNMLQNISPQHIPLAQNNPGRKKILIDDSRGLSAFFIFGIGINIVMVITFAWWFSSEWRKSKK